MTSLRLNVWCFLVCLLVLVVALGVNAAATEEESAPVPVASPSPNATNDVVVCGVVLQKVVNLTLAETVVAHIDPLACADCCTSFFRAAGEVRKINQNFNNTLGVGVRVIVARGEVGLALLIGLNHPNVVALMESAPKGVFAFFWPFTVPVPGDSHYNKLPEGAYDELQKEITQSKESEKPPAEEKQT